MNMTKNFAAKTRIVGSVNTMVPGNNKILDLVEILTGPVAAVATELRKTMDSFMRELYSVMETV